MVMAFRKWIAIFAVFLEIFIVPSLPEKAPYKSFAKDGTSATATEYYDYIVIGGGTAGCPLAATLSASAKVLLLERGGLPYDNPNVTHMSGFPNSLADTSPASAAQTFISTDGVFNHRGRVVGGSSAINGGFYTRASSDYVARVGWEAELVKDSYAWVERKVAFRPRLTPWQVTVRDGLVESGVAPPYNGFTYDHLQGTKIGGSIFDEKGIRHSAADLLEYADPTNITLYFNSVVHQILFKKARGKVAKASGVVFKDSKGQTHEAYLNNGTLNEIILSAGAMGSPQILMLSGIGPARKLRAMGIRVVLDQPMVGQGMADNPRNNLIIPSRNNTPVDFSLIQVVGINDEIGSYIESYSGFIEVYSLKDHPSFGIQVASCIYISNIHLLKIKFDQGIEATTIPTNQTLINGSETGVLGEKVSGPFSTGYMELRSKDPNENPEVTFNYFKDARDLERCVGGMKMVRKIVESPSLSRFRSENSSFDSLVELMLSIPMNLRRKHANATRSLEQFCVDTVMTIWHYHGGCHVGSVVDRDYKVVGVESLRVVDGSTFHHSPGTNPQATVMMLGRYMGYKILQHRNLALGRE